VEGLLILGCVLAVWYYYATKQVITKENVHRYRLYYMSHGDFVPGPVSAKLEKVDGWEGLITYHQALWLHPRQLQRVVDRKHPRSIEITEHLHGLRLLEGREGGWADLERSLLLKGLQDIRLTAHRQKLIDDAAYVRQIRPELDAIHELRRAGNRIHVEDRAAHWRQLEEMD
jgi:hypothetical protein